MRWEHLLFAHWQVPPASLSSLLPRGVTLDLHEGAAWLGVVPFRMSWVRPRRLPAAPWASFFPELNVRTYVLVNGIPGVWFFSLDAANPLAVWGARRWFHLPYFHARMRCAEHEGWVHYSSRRTHRNAPPAEFAARYRPTGDPRPAEQDSLEAWLVERYCLYSADPQGRLYRGAIQHIPWPLQPAELEIERCEMTALLGLKLPETPPLAHFARRIDVNAWSLDAAAAS